MTFPKIVRTIGKSVIKTIPLLRRQLLTATDYSRLDGLEAARREASFMGGWMARRTVRRQEAADESLLAAMKRGEPRVDFQIAAQAVKATRISHPRLLEALVSGVGLLQRRGPVVRRRLGGVGHGGLLGS